MVLFKISNTLFLIVFVMSALAQYNDPDALPWIAIYLTGAAMCVAQWLGGKPKWLPHLLLAISLVWAGSLLSQIAGQVSWSDIFDSLSMKTQAVEEAREIGGLMLIAIWAGAISIRQQQHL